MSATQPPNKAKRPGLVRNIRHPSSGQSSYAHVIAAAQDSKSPSADTHKHHEFFDS